MEEKRNNQSGDIPIEEKIDDIVFLLTRILDVIIHQPGAPQERIAEDINRTRTFSAVKDQLGLH